MDIDLYAVLDLPVHSTAEQIQARIESLEKDVSNQPETEATHRQKQLLLDARATLLHTEKRAEYDKQTMAKRNFEQARAREKPVPLKVGNLEIETWVAVEPAFTAYPDTGLFLLQDGELEAWLRWSLGQRQRANWVREIAMQSRSSDTPFMEYEMLLRLINANRPLVLYPKGGRPGSQSTTVEQVSDIPKLADKQWSLFVERLPYLLDWIAQYGDRTILERLESFPAHPIADVQLERLIYIIDPQTLAPSAMISGITDNKIDFGTLSKWETGNVDVTVTQHGRGFLYGTVSSSAAWITLSQDKIIGASTTLQIGLDRSKLSSGEQIAGTVSINLVDGRVAPIVIEVFVEQRTVAQSVGNVFNNIFKKRGG
jgi:hypothetical protein